jgi:hypothetical protein
MIIMEGEGHINRYLRLDIHSWRIHAIMCFICFTRRTMVFVILSVSIRYASCVTLDHTFLIMTFSSFRQYYSHST